MGFCNVICRVEIVLSLHGYGDNVLNRVVRVILFITPLGHYQRTTWVLGVLFSI